MTNRALAQRLALSVLVVAGTMIWAGCTAATSTNDQSGSGQNQGQGETKSGQDNGAHDLTATQPNDNTPEAQGTPDASSTGESKGDQKVSGVIQAINGSTVTIDGVTYTVKDASLLTGLKVGDTITFKLETNDSGSVVLIEIQHGEDNGTPGATDDHGQSTLEATDDHGQSTLEATDDHGQSTLEATDDHGQSTLEPTEAQGQSTPQATEDISGGSGGGSGSGGGGGGSDDGGGHK